MTYNAEPHPYAPKQVTIRYARRIITRGHNDNFELLKLIRQDATTPDGLIVGYYYAATVFDKTSCSETATGVTPDQAVWRALEKLGVTFRGH